MLPAEIQRGTKFYYAQEDGLKVREFKFHHWLGGNYWYAHTTTGLQPNNKRCWLNREDAVKYCKEKLMAVIQQLERGDAN